MGRYHRRHWSGDGIDVTWSALVYHLISHIPVEEHSAGEALAEEHIVGKVSLKGYLVGEVPSPPLTISPIELQAFPGSLHQIFLRISSGEGPTTITLAILAIAMGPSTILRHF